MARDDGPEHPAQSPDVYARIGPVGTLFAPRIQGIAMALVAPALAPWPALRLRSGTIAALSIIVGNPGIAQVGISRLIRLDKAAVTAIVNTLEHLGWAERRSVAGDRRRNALYPTEAGIAALEQSIASVRASEERVLEVLTPAEQAQLIALLDRLGRHIPNVTATVHPSQGR